MIELNFEKYELHIGVVKSFPDFNEMPLYKMVITKEQLSILLQFANVEVDSSLNKVYILNDVRFYIHPHFEPAKTEK